MCKEKLKKKNNEFADEKKMSKATEEKKLTDKKNLYLEIHIIIRIKKTYQLRPHPLSSYSFLNC